MRCPFIDWRSLVACCCLNLAAPSRAAEPVELFNGTDLAGWKQRGGAAKYAVEDGAIVGRSVPNTSNTFLTTEKDYGDFELELDFKIDDPTFNSGIQIRSHARQKDGGEIVYGYQVEIDPRKDRGLDCQDSTSKPAATSAMRVGSTICPRTKRRGRHLS